MACNVLSGVPFLLFLRLTSSIAHTANGRYAYFYVGCDLCLINCGFCLDNQPFCCCCCSFSFSQYFNIRCSVDFTHAFLYSVDVDALEDVGQFIIIEWYGMEEHLLLTHVFFFAAAVAVVSVNSAYLHFVSFLFYFFFRFCIEKSFISHAVVSSWPAKRMLWKDCKCDVRCMLLMSSGLGCWHFSGATDLKFYFSTCCEQICSSCDRNEYSIFINATIYHFTNAYDIEISRKVAIQHSVNWRWYYAEQKCT